VGDLERDSLLKREGDLDFLVGDLEWDPLLKREGDFMVDDLDGEKRLPLELELELEFDLDLVRTLRAGRKIVGLDFGAFSKQSSRELPRGDSSGLVKSDLT